MLSALSTRLATSCIRQKTITSVLCRFYSDRSESGRRKDRVFLNEVRLLGRVGAEPMLRGDKFPVAIFPLATSMFWYAEGTTKERVDWHRVVCGLPSLKDRVMKTVTRGDRVMVLGSVQYKEYIDKNGHRHNSTFISAARVLNLTNSRLQQSSAAAGADEEDDAEDDQQKYSESDMYDEDVEDEKNSKEQKN